MSTSEIAAILENLARLTAKKAAAARAKEGQKT